MKKGWIVLIIVGILIFLTVSWVVSKYNGFVTLDESLKQSWAQVENVYQRRADLIPNLVETVKGYASHEKEVLVGVTEARAKLGGQVNIGTDVINNPQAFQKFQQMQGALTQALQRLMVVVERYPELKADQRFADLQRQLEGTENRISVERRRFTEAVAIYNNGVRRFPGKLIAGIFGFPEKEQFQAQQGADEVPKVEF